MSANLQIRFASVLLVLSIVAIGSLTAGCNPGKTTGRPESAKTVPNPKSDTIDLADKAIKDLGGEKAAFLAILGAWEDGYSLGQIVKGIQAGTLGEDGAIDGVNPLGKPRASGQRRIDDPLLVAASPSPRGQGYLVADSSVQLNQILDERFENRKSIWTAWLLGVIAHGYSPEQIAEFMLFHPEPGACGLWETPCIFTEVKDPATGKVRNKVLKPAFAPEYPVTAQAPANGQDVVTYEGLAEDFGRDLDALLEGSKQAGGSRGTGKPDPSKNEGGSGRPGAAGATKFTAAVLKPKLSTMPGNPDKLISYDITLRISDKGKIEGNYELKAEGQGEIRVESGTFEGSAIYPTAEGQKIRMDINGSEKMTATSMRTGNERTDNATIPKMFQGVLSLDSSEGSGFLFARSMMLQWQLED